MAVLYIIIPAYNESENIEKVIEQWYPIVERYNGNNKSRLVIIDDGSKDNTYEIICKCAKNKELLVPITKKNGGHGAAILYGYNYAIKNNADYIFQTDSDGQTVPEEFIRFWKEKENYDMLIGDRQSREDGLSRVFVTKVLKMVIRVCFGVSIKDANTPFRLMKVQTLKKYIGLIPEDYNLSNVLISVIYAKKKCKVQYYPITFRPRQGGVNSINFRRIVGIGKKAIGDFIELNKILERS